MIFFNTEPYGAGNYKRYSYSFHPIWAKLYDKIRPVIGENKVMDILAICPKIKHFVSLLNFSIGVNGKRKMRNISKTTDRRAKIDKNVGLWVLQYIYVGYFSCPNTLDWLVWGHSVHFAKFRFHEVGTLLLQQFSSDINQTSYKVS